jgi:hypothetical protein
MAAKTEVMGKKKGADSEFRYMNNPANLTVMSVHMKKSKHYAVQLLITVYATNELDRLSLF